MNHHTEYKITPTTDDYFVVRKYLNCSELDGLVDFKLSETYFVDTAKGVCSCKRYKYLKKVGVKRKPKCKHIKVCEGLK